MGRGFTLPPRNPPMYNLPLPDRAGRGALEQRIQLIVRDLHKAGRGRNPEEFSRLERLLDQARKDFHRLYGVKEHPVQAPIPQHV